MKTELPDGFTLPPDALSLSTHDSHLCQRRLLFAIAAAVLWLTGCTSSRPNLDPPTRSVPELLAKTTEETAAQFEDAYKKGDMGLMAAILSRPFPGVEVQVKSGSPYIGRYVVRPVDIVRMGKSIPTGQAQQIQLDDVLTVRADQGYFGQRRGSGLEPHGEFRRLTDLLANMRLRLGSQVVSVNVVTATSGPECEPTPSNWILKDSGLTRQPYVGPFRQWLAGFFSTVPVEVLFDPDSKLHRDASHSATLSISTCFEASKREFAFGGPGNNRWVAAAVNGGVTFTIGQVQVFSRCFRGTFVGPRMLPAGSKLYLAREEAPLADALAFSDLPAALTDLVADYWGGSRAAEATGKVLKDVARHAGPFSLEPYADAVFAADPSRYRPLADELVQEMRRSSSHSAEKWAAVFPERVLPRVPTVCAAGTPPMPAERSRVTTCAYKDGKCERVE
jgi:hypothetical protein